MKCSGCGAENPSDASSCKNCGAPYNSKQSKSITIPVVTIVLVVITMVIAAFLYISISPPSFPPSIEIHTATDLAYPDVNNHNWVIVEISGVSFIPKSDVYVELLNASGYVIQNEPLTTVSGTHGFKYTPASSGDYLSVGDVFSLSKNYTVGCTITLGHLSSPPYCVLTVQ